MSDAAQEKDTVTVYVLNSERGAGRFAVSEADLHALGPAMLDSVPGDRYTVDVEEWSREEYDDLPEWDGW